MARVVWWDSASVIAAAKGAAIAAMTERAEDVLAAANEIVPLNKRDLAHRGTLMASGTVDIGRDGVTVRYSVDEPFDYAEVQHETPPGPHWTHLPGRDWHYLSRPFGLLVGDGEAGGGPRREYLAHVKGWVGRVLRTRP